VLGEKTADIIEKICCQRERSRIEGKLTMHRSYDDKNVKSAM
jgi:hypothetical protein